MANDYGANKRRRRKTIDFNSLVLPMLLSNNWNQQEVQEMFADGRIRIRHARRDFQDFSVVEYSPPGRDIGRQDKLIHNLWKEGTDHINNCCVVTCFIVEKDTVKRLASAARTDLYTLSDALSKYGVVQKGMNSASQTFRTISYRHPH